MRHPGNRWRRLPRAESNPQPRHWWCSAVNPLKNGVSPGPQSLALLSAQEEMSHDGHTDDDFCTARATSPRGESKEPDSRLPQAIRLL